MSGRSGFSLVEITIVALLGSLMVLTTYQVLVTNQDSSRTQRSRTQVEQSTRAAMDIVFSDLREVSVRDGDLLVFEPDHIEFRAMTTLGGVCSVDMPQLSATPTMLVRKVKEDFRVGDSIVVYADNDPLDSADDTWIKGRVSSVDTTAVCTDSRGVDYEAGRIEFSGQSEAFMADTVRQGAPMRAFTQYAYGLTTYGDEAYLGRSEEGGAWVPLVGPLATSDGHPGLEFAYLQTDGQVATRATAISRIDILLRTRSRAGNAGGGTVVDSVATSVFVRN